MMKFKKIFSSLCGNAIEWYDYLLFIYLAPIFSQQFFPAHSKLTALIISLAIFAVSNLSRPLGGLLIGSLSDYYGRRYALLITIILMTLASFAMAIAPTHGSVGMLAGLFILVIRLMQSIAVSGEFNTASVYLCESAKNNRAFYGSLVSASASVGAVFGAMTVYLLRHSLSDLQLANWGWRLPFLLAALFSVYVGYLRFMQCDNLEMCDSVSRPWRLVTKILSSHRGAVLVAIAYTSIMSIGNYFIFSYFNIYQIEVLHFNVDHVMGINIICILLSLIAIPLFGLLADKLGTNRCYMMGVLCLLCTIPGLFYGLSVNSIVIMFLSQCIFVLLISMVAAALPMMLNQLFPEALRTTGTALAYNIAIVGFGGTAPLVALSLVQYTHIQLMPGYYLMLCCALAIIAHYFKTIRALGRQALVSFKSP